MIFLAIWLPALLASPVRDVPTGALVEVENASSLWDSTKDALGALPDFKTLDYDAAEFVPNNFFDLFTNYEDEAIILQRFQELESTDIVSSSSERRKWLDWNNDQSTAPSSSRHGASVSKKRPRRSDSISFDPASPPSDTSATSAVAIETLSTLQRGLNLNFISSDFHQFLLDMYQKGIATPEFEAILFELFRRLDVITGGARLEAPIMKSFQDFKALVSVPAVDQTTSIQDLPQSFANVPASAPSASLTVPEPISVDHERILNQFILSQFSALYTGDFLSAAFAEASHCNVEAVMLILRYLKDNSKVMPHLSDVYVRYAAAGCAFPFSEDKKEIWQNMVDSSSGLSLAEIALLFNHVKLSRTIFKSYSAEMQTPELRYVFRMFYDGPYYLTMKRPTRLAYLNRICKSTSPILDQYAMALEQKLFICAKVLLSYALQDKNLPVVLSSRIKLNAEFVSLFVTTGHAQVLVPHIQTDPYDVAASMARERCLIYPPTSGWEFCVQGFEESFRLAIQTGFSAEKFDVMLANIRSLGGHVHFGLSLDILEFYQRAPVTPLTVKIFSMLASLKHSPSDIFEFLEKLALPETDKNRLRLLIASLTAPEVRKGIATQANLMAHSITVDNLAKFLGRVIDETIRRRNEVDLLKQYAKYWLRTLPVGPQLGSGILLMTYEQRSLALFEFCFFQLGYRDADDVILTLAQQALAQDHSGSDSEKLAWRQILVKIVSILQVVKSLSPAPP